MRRWIGACLLIVFWLLFAFGGYVILQEYEDKIALEESDDKNDCDEIILDRIQIGKVSNDTEQSSSDTKKESAVSSEDTFDYIAIGNSVTCNVIDENLWWGEWGMAATAPEKDYVHLIIRWLEENSSQKVSSTVLNLKPWELAQDRSKVLNEYSSPDSVNPTSQLFA